MIDIALAAVSINIRNLPPHYAELNSLGNKQRSTVAGEIVLRFDISIRIVIKRLVFDYFF